MLGSNRLRKNSIVFYRPFCYGDGLPSVLNGFVS